jgi:CheY-like chemotaxis protein
LLFWRVKLLTQKDLTRIKNKLLVCIQRLKPAMTGKTNSRTVPIADAPPADTSPYRPTVLVVDDESLIADTVAEILSRNGYAPTTAYDAEGALEMALLTPPELLIADVVLPGMSGIELAIKLRHIYPDCKVLLFSGQASTADLMATAHRSGHTFTLLSKPLHPRELLANVAESLKLSSVVGA